ncbi:hypothetical protein [Nocardia terpenica]|uniref:hypothetical protein n=1 Tax=Nocardia terpenica TaxID=455432 RepID=UPI001EEBCE7A|nr:hypothetical protein [Nocardia terpenica]
MADFTGRSAIVTDGIRVCSVRFILTEATFSTGSEFVLDGGATVGQFLALSSES